MKRTSISMDRDLFQWCESRAKQLGLTTSQFFRILAHNERARKQEGLSIVAEQAATYGSTIINHQPAKKRRLK